MSTQTQLSTGSRWNINPIVHDAAEQGDVGTIESALREWPLLIDAVHPKRLGRTPMHSAAANGHVAVIETLHRLGSAALDTPNTFGWTPLHFAAHYDQSAAAETLIRLGSAAIDQRNNNGWTPMDTAIWEGHPLVLETLVRLGATTVERRGVELMRLAFSCEHKESAEILLAAGVDAAALNDDWPMEVHELLATPAERTLHLRDRLYFSTTLLDILLAN